MRTARSAGASIRCSSQVSAQPGRPAACAGNRAAGHGHHPDAAQGRGHVGSFSEADDKPVMAGEKPVMEEVKIK